MHLTSQGLTFLGLTAKKYETINNSPRSLDAVQKKLETFEQTGTAFAQTAMTLGDLKELNCRAYVLVDGEKQLISEKSWDRGGILEGKVPLEEGIAKGLYRIEELPKPTVEENLDAVLENLKEKIVKEPKGEEAASSLGKLPQAPTFASEGSKKFKSKFDVKKESAFKFIS